MVRVLGEPVDVGRTFPVRYSITAADGTATGFDQNVDTRFEPHPIDPTRATASVMTFRFYGFPLPEFGTYHFDVHRGDERLARVPFWVVPVDQQQPGAGAEAGEERGYL